MGVVLILLITGFSGLSSAQGPSQPSNFVMEVLGTLRGPGCVRDDVPGLVVRSEVQDLLQVRIGDPLQGGFVGYDLADQLIGSLWTTLCQPESGAATSPLVPLTAMYLNVECPMPPSQEVKLYVTAEGESLADATPPSEYTYEASTGSCIPLPDYTDKIAAGGTHPDRVWVKETYPITSFIKNIDDLPHLIGVEVYPNTGNICSLSSEVSSTGTQLREREYLLFAEGTEEQLSPLGQFIQLGDQISISTDVDTTAIGGTCEVFLVYTIDAVFWGSQIFSTSVVIPAPVADFGTIVVTTGCVTPVADGLDNPASVTVTSGAIEVFADLDFAKQCDSHRFFGTMLIEKKREGSASASGDPVWDPICAAVTANTDVVRAECEDDVDGGPHEYRVVGKGWRFHITLGCLVSLVGIGLSVAGLLVPGANAIAWLGLVVSVISALLTCFSLDVTFEFTVKVTAIDPNASIAVLMNDTGNVVDGFAPTNARAA